MKKKLIACLVAASMTVASVFSMVGATATSPTQPPQNPVEAEDQPGTMDSGLKVEANTNADAEAELTKVEATVPEGQTAEETPVQINTEVTVDGTVYTVTTIKAGACESLNGVAYKRLVIPSTITKIENGALKGMSEKTVLKINAGDVKIAKKAFQGLKTKKMTVYISPTLTKKEIKAVRAQLKKAGFKGKVKKHK